MEKSMLAEAENLDMKAVAKVAQNVSVKEIFLVETKASRNPSVKPSDTLSLNYEISTEILKSAKGNLPILCNFVVEAFSKKKPDNIIMNIEASFCVSYELEPEADIDSREIQEFSKINPIYNLWSYWREFVQSMTTRMGFPVLTVPLLHIVPKKPQKDRPKRIGKTGSIHRKKKDRK